MAPTMTMDLMEALRRGAAQHDKHRHSAEHAGSGCSVCEDNRLDGLYESNPEHEEMGSDD